MMGISVYLTKADSQIPDEQKSSALALSYQSVLNMQGGLHRIFTVLTTFSFKIANFNERYNIRKEVPTKFFYLIFSPFYISPKTYTQCHKIVGKCFMLTAESSSELSCVRAHLYAADRSCLALESASTATAISPATGGPQETMCENRGRQKRALMGGCLLS